MKLGIIICTALLVFTGCKRNQKVLIPPAVARATTEAALYKTINQWITNAALDGKTYAEEYVTDYSHSQVLLIMASLLDSGYAVRVRNDDKGNAVKVYFAWDDIERFNSLNGDAFYDEY